ncbi:MAG: hypothetical protein JO123_08645 [Ktedonobacteraceae bacterium]|nr:hypothetical protein [Ktedonobacteraceae bacterium]
MSGIAVKIIIHIIEVANVADFIEREPPMGGKLSSQRPFGKRVSDFLQPFFLIRFPYQIGDRR